MQLSLDDLTNLASQRPIGGRHPWDSNDEAQVDGFYRRVCAELERTLPAASRIAWGHYGSGYASFVDAWFYREERDFKTGKGDQHIGLVILLCRLAPCFVFMQGENGAMPRAAAATCPRWTWSTGWTRRRSRPWPSAPSPCWSDTDWRAPGVPNWKRRCRRI